MKEKIYFIPGLMTDNRLWKRVLPLLDDKYEIVHISIPQSTDFDEINKILFEKFKNEEKINLLGFSLGGYIASYFADINCKLAKTLLFIYFVFGFSHC